MTVTTTSAAMPATGATAATAAAGATAAIDATAATGATTATDATAATSATGIPKPATCKTSRFRGLATAASERDSNASKADKVDEDRISNAGAQTQESMRRYEF